MCFIENPKINTRKIYTQIKFKAIFVWINQFDLQQSWARVLAFIFEYMVKKLPGDPGTFHHSISRGKNKHFVRNLQQKTRKGITSWIIFPMCISSVDLMNIPPITLFLYDFLRNLSYFIQFEKKIYDILKTILLWMNVWWFHFTVFF